MKSGEVTSKDAAGLASGATLLWLTDRILRKPTPVLYFFVRALGFRIMQNFARQQYHHGYHQYSANPTVLLVQMVVSLNRGTPRQTPIDNNPYFWVLPPPPHSRYP